MAWYDIIGIIGVAFILGAYLLLQLQKIKPDTVIYSILNALGAAFILISLYFDFNLSAVIIETAWLLISLLGILQAIRRKSS